MLAQEGGKAGQTQPDYLYVCTLLKQLPLLD